MREIGDWSLDEIDGVIRLRYGRRTGLLIAGVRDGYPVLHCHGFLSSRLDVRLLKSAAAEAGAGWIGIDRAALAGPLRAVVLLSVTGRAIFANSPTS